MRDRSEQILRLLCWVLVALVVVQLVHAVFRGNPLAHVTVPAIPTLETNLAKASKHEVVKKAEPKKTRPKKIATSSKSSAQSKTNTLAKVGSHNAKTNVESTTNTIVAGTEVSTNVVGTNLSSSTASLSNVVAASGDKTNLAVATTNHPADTRSNAVANIHHSEKHRPHLPPIMAMHGAVHFAGGPMPMMPGMRGHGPKLSPDIQSRVDKIVNSEILAPVMHPLPMALLGIAGDYAFLRAASGQTGMVQVGGKVGDLKLLRIGINRVLIEQDGKQKELKIFNGYGGKSLLHQTKTNEISK